MRDHAIKTASFFVRPAVRGLLNERLVKAGLRRIRLVDNAAGEGVFVDVEDEDEELPSGRSTSRGDKKADGLGGVEGAVDFKENPRACDELAKSFA